MRMFLNRSNKTSDGESDGTVFRAIVGMGVASTPVDDFNNVERYYIFIFLLLNDFDLRSSHSKLN